MNLTLHVWRQKGPTEKGRFVTYKANDVSPHMSFLEMLDVVNEGLLEKGETPIAFDHDCREGICGMCGMVINGKPDLACRTLTSKFNKPDITLMPLPVFDLIGDLSVNTGKFNRETSERVQTWIHDEAAESTDLKRLEAIGFAQGVTN